MKRFFKAFASRLNFWVLALLLLAFFVLLDRVLVRQNRRFDLTRNNIFSLSQKTVDILKSVTDQPVKVKAFFKGDQPGREELEDYLKMYAFQTPNFKYEFIDPDRNPGQAKLYRVDEYGTVVMERGAKKETFQEISEEAITNALLKLVQVRTKTVAFTKGHNEKLINEEKEGGYNSFQNKLKADNYQINEIVLSHDGIPDGTDLVIAAGPVIDFLPEELVLLKEYAEKGGAVLLLLDPVEQRLSKFEDWLGQYGVVLGQDVVVDKLSRLFGADYLIPVVTQYGDHPITKNFNLASFLPFTRSVTAKKEVPQGFTVTELAKTSPSSWAETNWGEIDQGQVTVDEDDIKGPVSLAVAVQKENSTMRIAVFGDSEFADNAHFYLSGNKDMILNTVAWLAKEEKLISIRSKERETSPLVLSAEQQKLVFALPVFVLPLISLGSGIAVLVYRRRYN